MALLVAGALFVAALGLVLADLVTQHQRFDQADAALRATRHRTTAVTAQLDQLRRDLDLLTTQVGDDTTALAQRTSELKGAQWALTITQMSITEQTARISSLQTCLGGVEQALNALAVGNPGDAAQELSAVSSSCTAATAGA